MDLRDSVPFAAHHNCTTGCTEMGDHVLEEDIGTVLDFEECEHAVRERQYLSILEEGDDYFEDYKNLVLQNYHHQRSTWLKSKCREQLFKRLTRLPINSRSGKITKAVAMGLNLLGFGGRGIQCFGGRDPEVAQLVIFLDIVHLLEKRLGKDIQLYAQEPNFRPIDEAFLAELGVRILHIPEAEDMCEDDMFFFLPFCPWPMVDLINQKFEHQPAWMIGASQDFIQTMSTARHLLPSKSSPEPTRFQYRMSNYTTFNIQKGCKLSCVGDSPGDFLSVLSQMHVLTKGRKKRHRRAKLRVYS
ncbi:hypothetical protein AC578_7866 [Pseudocercospora eumusae]|uniref:SRR1-like domain-containing protein n=1 Tax=Pseudocercospora eumusae TaxID=321146 RepID=A0A139HIV7_9PEZI|nr:hypothetical protein AC578_7866 [Pseudocercospora eumusae]